MQPSVRELISTDTVGYRAFDLARGYVQAHPAVDQATPEEFLAGLQSWLDDPQLRSHHQLLVRADQEELMGRLRAVLLLSNEVPRCRLDYAPKILVTSYTGKTPPASEEHAHCRECDALWTREAGEEDWQLSRAGSKPLCSRNRQPIVLNA